VNVLEAYDLMMREQVVPALRDMGFKGTIKRFTLGRGKASGGFQWQKDSRFYRAGLVRFTANVTYWCGADRIGTLMPAPARDTWWELNGDLPTEPVAKSVIGAVRCYALQAIEAGLEDPDRPERILYWRTDWPDPSGDDDDGGAEPSAWYVQPAGTPADELFAGFTDPSPIGRVQAAESVTELAAGDPRTLPALLDRVLHDPSPRVRSLVATRTMPVFADDSQVMAALRAIATLEDAEVRWAARYAIRLISGCGQLVEPVDTGGTGRGGVGRPDS